MRDTVAICRRAVTAALEPLERRMMMARFAAIGDLGDNGALTAVAAMVKGWNPAHIVTVGDNDNIDHTDFESTVGQHFHDWMSPYLGSWGAGSTTGNRFWPAMGNHDWESSRGSRDYTDYFTLPGNERYYNVKLDNVEFFMIDSDQREPDGTSATSTQANWLKNALAASTARWQIVIAHHPPYTSGTEPDATWLRTWDFKGWGADAMLSGHQHHYERLDHAGLPIMVTGRAGATTGGGFGTIDSRSRVRYNGDDGAMMIESTDTSLNFKFHNRSGTVIDNFTVTAAAATTPLVNPGSSWKFLDNGSNQGAAWRATSFVDSSWASGSGQLGYGDGDESTVLSFGPNASSKFITTYFRKSFTVADPSALASLELKLLRDDGGVVYLNGVEVYRSNMPTGTISSSTLASGSVEDAWETVTLSSSFLQAGNNVLAVEVHQSSGGSSDLSFDLSLAGINGAATPTAPLAPSGLAASAASASQINLTWADNSTNETGFRIERSTGGGMFTEIATVAAGVTTFADTGRAAGTSYSYRVRAYNTVGTSGYSNAASATTQSAPGGGGGVVYLSDLPFAQTPLNGYGPVERDMGNGSNGAGDGAPIALNGVVYPKGLGAHAASDILFNLSGAYATFLADIGVDDRQATNGSIVFQVWLDGVKTYESPIMRPTSATLSLNIPVTGKNQLRLVITDAGDGNSFDHGDWAGARLVPATSTGAGPAAPSGLSAVAASSSQIDLTWIDTVSNETGFRIYRSTDNVNFTEAGTVAAGVTAFSDTGRAASTTYWYRVRAFNGAGESTNSTNASAKTLAAPAPSLPSPWTNADIGAVGQPGSATFANGAFSIDGAGSDIWANADGLHYVFQQLTGDGTIVARVTGVENTNAWAKAGLMMRETLAASARHASVHVSPSSGTVLTYRDASGGVSNGIFSSGAAPEWLRLRRAGNTFTAWRSEDSVNWTQIGSVTIGMTSTIYVGLAVTAKTTATVNTSTFTNVTVTSGTTTAATFSSRMIAPSTTTTTSMTTDRELLAELA